MSEKKSYLTVGLYGIHDAEITVTVPKYIMSVEYDGDVFDGCLDGDLLTEDGYENVLALEGDSTGLILNKLQKGDDIKIEIRSSTSTTIKEDK